MSGHDHGAGGFEQLARQYWAAFADLARGDLGGARGGDAAQAPGSANPFGGAAFFAQNPFAQAPFAAGNPFATANPFATNNPFAANAGFASANPFAAGQGGGAGAVPGWKEGLEWWTQLVQPASGQLDAALQRMTAQSADWFGLMQQLAGSLAGRDATPDQIAGAWQQMLGNGLGAHGIVELFKRMAGPGAQGFEQWLAQVQPWMAMLRAPQMPAGSPQQRWHEQMTATLRMPTFGLAREHQERWQALMQAAIDYQQANTAFNALLLRVAQRAFERFETRLEERSEPGRQLDSARALFDVWIDAAEDAWQQIALTEEFRGVYGRLANTQMRLRGAVQTEFEQIAGAFGMPSRTEMDASHRKVAALERELRRMQRAARDAAPRAPRSRPEPMPARASNDEAAPAPAAKKRAVRARSAPAAAQRAAAQAPAKTRKAPRTPAPRKRQTAVLPTVTAPRALDRRAARADAGTKKKARK